MKTKHNNQIRALFEFAENRVTKGFTLIEVLVAVAIISIGFMGVYTLHIQSISANDAVRFHLKAPLLAQQKIVETDSMLEELSESSGEFGSEFPGFSWKIIPVEIKSETFEKAEEVLKCYNLEVFNKRNSYAVKVFRYMKQSD